MREYSAVPFAAAQQQRVLIYFLNVTEIIALMKKFFSPERTDIGGIQPPGMDRSVRRRFSLAPYTRPRLYLIYSSLEHRSMSDV